MVLSDFDDYVKIVRVIMSLVGIWPENHLNGKWYLRYYYFVPTFCIIFFNIIPQTRMLFIVKNNLNAVLGILNAGAVIMTLCVIKSFTIWCNIQDFKNLLTEMREDWKNIDKFKNNALWKNAKLGKLIINSMVIINVVSIVQYALMKFIFLNVHIKEMRNMVNVTFTKPLFVDSKFYCETENSPIFEIIWISQLISTFFAAFEYIGVDGFLMISIMHACAQFQNLQHDLKNLTSNLRDNKFSTLEKSIIKRHIRFKRFTKSIEEKFNKVFLVLMFSSSVTLSLLGYQAVNALTGKSTSGESDSIFMLHAVIYTSLHLTGVFVYCFIAEQLRIESSKIYTAAWEMNWYELKPEESRMLLFVMHASRLPIDITVGKFSSLSMEYFLKVLKTAFGYLSMLLAVQSRDHP